MNKINDGGQAFPIPGDEECVKTKGMTLRDYFAAKAMQSLVGQFEIPHLTTDSERSIFHKGIAKNAYEIADEMLKAKEAK